MHLALFVLAWGTPDINYDGVVDARDLGTLLGNWGPCGSWAEDPRLCAGDLNLDGVVNSADLARLLAEWTRDD